MALSSKDPILTAFELSWELRLLSRLENELKVEYEQLAKQCQDFAVDLLDQTRGSKELEILLNYDSEGPVSDGGDRMNLARLKLAIKYKQKRVCCPLHSGIFHRKHLRLTRNYLAPIMFIQHPY